MELWDGKCAGCLHDEGSRFHRYACLRNQGWFRQGLWRLLANIERATGLTL